MSADLGTYGGPRGYFIDKVKDYLLIRLPGMEEWEGKFSDLKDARTVTLTSAQRWGQDPVWRVHYEIRFEEGTILGRAAGLTGEEMIGLVGFVACLSMAQAMRQFDRVWSNPGLKEQLEQEGRA